MPWLSGAVQRGWVPWLSQEQCFLTFFHVSVPKPFTIAEVLSPTWGAQAPSQQAFCSWILFMKGVVDGSPKFLRVTSRKLLSQMTEGFFAAEQLHKPASSLSPLSHHPQCIFVPFTCSHIFPLLTFSPPFSAHQLFSLFHTYPLLSVSFFSIPDPFLLFFSLLTLFFGSSLSVPLAHPPPASFMSEGHRGPAGPV